MDYATLISIGIWFGLIVFLILVILLTIIMVSEIEEKNVSRYLLIPIFLLFLTAYLIPNTLIAFKLAYWVVIAHLLIPALYCLKRLFDDDPKVFSTFLGVLCIVLAALIFLKKHELLTITDIYSILSEFAANLTHTQKFLLALSISISTFILILFLLLKKLIIPTIYKYIDKNRRRCSYCITSAESRWSCVKNLILKRIFNRNLKLHGWIMHEWGDLECNRCQDKKYIGKKQVESIKSFCSSDEKSKKSSRGFMSMLVK